MNLNNLLHRPPGIRFDESGQAVVLLWAPEAKRVQIEVSGNIKIDLESQEYGYWALVTDLIRPGDPYGFILDDNKILPDPASVSQSGVHGPSIAVDLGKFDWSDGGWKNPALKEYIIYEVHTGTFTDEGTFAAMETKLDYLVDLGITAIEIMPVSQFAGDRNWGYDGVFPYCVQDSYGGAAGLQHFVDACHSKGLAVILDVVFNHIGPEGNVLHAYGPYFTDKYHTPWGDAINFDDAWSDEVRQYFIENALMWFRDFHIDALRLDAVHAIRDFSPVHILQEIKQRTAQLEAQTGGRHYLIVEMDLNDTRFLNPAEKGGYGMDAQWIDEFHHALRVSSGQEKTGYYSDFEPLYSLAKSFKDAYVYDGQYSAHRKRKFGVSTKGHSADQFVVFSQNHDQVGNRMLGERTSQLVSGEMQKLLAGAVLSAPYLPLLFMGEEWSEPHSFQYFVSHTNPELAEAVRKGRKSEFAAFHLEGEAPDPMSVETFNNSKLQWELLAQSPHQQIFQYYKKLIALRKQQPALKSVHRKEITVELDAENELIIINRLVADQHVIILLNFSKEVREISLPGHVNVWTKLISSSDAIWDGPQTSPGEVQSAKVVMQPESFGMYADEVF